MTNIPEAVHNAEPEPMVRIQEFAADGELPPGETLSTWQIPTRALNAARHILDHAPSLAQHRRAFDRDGWVPWEWPEPSSSGSESLMLSVLRKLLVNPQSRVGYMDPCVWALMIDLAPADRQACIRALEILLQCQKPVCGLG